MEFLSTLLYLPFDLIVGILLLLGVLFYSLCSERNLPPGPTGLPIVGYLPFLGREAYRTLHQLAGKYGPVFSLYLGRKLVVVLDNFEVVKEALSNNALLDRPKNPPNHLLPNSTSLSVCNGQTWTEQRRFSVQCLRQFGMGKEKMEDIIHTELERLMQEIDSRKGDPMDLYEVLLPSISNNIYTLLAGEPLELKDEKRLFLNKMLQTMTTFFRPTRIHAYFPHLRSWMAKFKIWGYDQAEICMENLGNFITELIADHKSKLDENSAKDYIDSYLLKMNSKKTSASYSEIMLKGNFQSLFSAGSMPSFATLEWALLSMILYPEVRRTVHEELDSFLDAKGLPKWKDHENLPYTMAVIYEVMRHNSIVPIGMLRCSSTRTKLAGYNIPKGAIVMPNIWGVHHDSELWTDPHSFKPERFLQDGKVVKPQAFIPFSFGKRNCPGEDMATIMVFLYFATLMRHYSVSLPGNDRNIKQILGVAKLVVLDNVCLKTRI